MIRTCLAVAVLVGLSTPALAEKQWKKIGPGPDLAYAAAYCDNAAMGMPQQGYFVMGSQLQVGMTQFGHGLGAAIRQARYKRNCMTMLGWQQVNVTTKRKAKTNWNGGGNNK